MSACLFVGATILYQNDDNFKLYLGSVPDPSILPNKRYLMFFFISRTTYVESKFVFTLSRRNY